MMQWTWTEERIEALRGCLQQGLSAAQIAKSIGAPSKNAVVGKVHRLRQTDPTIKLVRRVKKQKNFAKKTKPKTEGLFLMRKWRGDDKQFELPFDPAAPVPKQIALVDLENHHCRYPHGEGKNIKFCGHTKKNGSSYCVYHAKLCEVKLG